MKRWWNLPWLALAAAFFWLFLERYWLYRDCIEAAASSCRTADGDNLTGGGVVWAVPALLCAGIGLWRMLRRR